MVEITRTSHTLRNYQRITYTLAALITVAVYERELSPQTPPQDW